MMDSKKDINYYIDLSRDMPNTSDGGSVAYHFDDVVLVKYSCYTKYGIAREDEEKLIEKVNEKNKSGVRTPAHIDIKRIVEEENNICYVLQEKAKGQSFCKYTSNNDISVQLEKQRELSNMPQEHFDQYASDIIELFNYGLELKPKNIYYDESLENGGFTIIDLWYNRKIDIPFDYDSIKDVLFLCNLLNLIADYSQISSYSKKTTEEQKEQSLELSYPIRLKAFLSLEKNIPNFDRYKRTILRTYPKDVLEYFDKNGLNVGDLRLSEEECEEFEKQLDNDVNRWLSMIENGSLSYEMVLCNEIHNDLYQEGFSSSWLYHRENMRDKNDYLDEDGNCSYKYGSDCEDDLNNKACNKLNEKIDILLSQSNNPFILKAKQASEERLKLLAECDEEERSF